MRFFVASTFRTAAPIVFSGFARVPAAGSLSSPLAVDTNSAVDSSRQLGSVGLFTQGSMGASGPPSPTSPVAPSLGSHAPSAQRSPSDCAQAGGKKQRPQSTTKLANAVVVRVFIIASEVAFE